MLTCADGKVGDFFVVKHISLLHVFRQKTQPCAADDGEFRSVFRFRFQVFCCCLVTLEIAEYRKI